MNTDSQLNTEPSCRPHRMVSLVVGLAVAFGATGAGLPAMAQEAMVQPEPGIAAPEQTAIQAVAAPAVSQPTETNYWWKPPAWVPPEWWNEWWEEEERRRQEEGSQPGYPDADEDNQPEDDPAPDAPDTPEEPGPANGEIRALLGELLIGPPEAGSRYSRAQFGKSWVDVDGNYCSTRNDILARDLTNVRRSGGCRVVSGDLLDPYTGKFIRFKAGRDTSSAVQIDHVVALRDAWDTGAQQLTMDQRVQFANDPLNLLAVDGPANIAKGHKNAAKWLPPRHAFRCHYLARQIAVKARYGLWVTPEEHRAFTNGLQHCPADMRVENDTIVGA